MAKKSVQKAQKAKNSAKHSKKVAQKAAVQKAQKAKKHHSKKAKAVAKK